MGTSPSNTDAPEPEPGNDGDESSARAQPVRDAPSPPRPSRRLVTLVTVPLIVLTAMAYAGEALFSTLTPDPDAGDPGHPLALILLAPSLRNFTLTSTSLDPLAYFGLGVPRVLLTDPLYYLLGFWYGNAAIRWMERRTRTLGTSLRQVEDGFSRYAYPILYALPYTFTTLLAGAARLPLWKVLLVRAAGITTRIALVRWLGWTFESSLADLLGWIGRYRLPILVVSVILVILTIVLEARKGETKVGSLTRLDEEIEEIEDPDPEPEVTEETDRPR